MPEDLTFVRRIKNENELISALILNDLRDLAEQDLNDHFVYQVGKAQIDLENAPYGGARYPVSALVDKKLYVRFQLDVGADFISLIQEKGSLIRKIPFQEELI